MRPITVSVGSLAAASATNISASQTIPAGQSVVIDGALSTGYSATSISTAASVSGAAALVLNGTTVSGGVAVINPPARVVIVSAANDSGITFTIKGILADGFTAASETITGANTSRTATATVFYKVLSITTSNSTAGNVSAGTNGVAALDKARRVLITSGGNDSSINFTITGTDLAGNPQSETLGGGNVAAVYSVLDYLTISRIAASAASASTVTVGTNGVASSGWVAFDPYAFGQAFVQAKVSGTVNYTVETTQDDPNSPTNAVAKSAVTWDSYAGPIVAAAASQSAAMSSVPAYARLTLNSGTGSVSATFTQYLSVPA